MRSCIFSSTADGSIWRSTLIIVRLSERPFSGSVSKADAPPVCLLPRLAQLASGHSCLVYNVYLNTLDFWKNLEDATPILRVPLSVFDVLCFPEEAPKLPENFLSLFRHFSEGFNVCFLWLLSHVQSGHFLEESFLEGPFKADCLQWGLKKLPENLSSRSRASWLDYYLKNFISPVPPIISEVSTLVSGLLL